MKQPQKTAKMRVKMTAFEEIFNKESCFVTEGALGLRLQREFGLQPDTNAHRAQRKGQSGAGYALEGRLRHCLEFRAALSCSRSRKAAGQRPCRGGRPRQGAYSGKS